MKIENIGNSNSDWREDDWTPPGWTDEEVAAQSSATAAWFARTGGRG